MKRMKKLFAILMTMAMVMGLGITGFAATNDNQISVSGAGLAGVTSGTEAERVQYGQIIMEDRESTIGWQFVNEEIQTAFVDAYNNAGIATSYSADQILDRIGGSETNENGNAIAGTISSDAKFSAALTAVANVATKPMTWDSIDKSWESVDNLTKGLYVVVANKSGYSYLPMAAYINSDGDGVDVVAKGAPDQIQKTVTAGGESVSAGDKVEYTVTLKYPFISADYVSPTFKITDTLTNATFGEDANVSITGLGTAGTDYSVTFSDDKDTLTINVTNYDRTKAGDPVTITYTVTVDDSVSSTDALENKVTSEVDVDGDGEEPSKKTEYKVISTPVKATINKVDDSEDQNTLPGSVFALYEGTGNDQTADTLISIIADADTTAGIELPDEYASYQDDNSVFKADGNPDGNIVFDGLDAQKSYYVVEIIAPEGYSIDGISHQLQRGNTLETNYPNTTTTTENNVTTVTTTYKYKDFTINSDETNTIVNTTIASLPSTGGMGTTLFTIAGCVIMISAAGLFFATRKKAN